MQVDQLFAAKDQMSAKPRRKVVKSVSSGKLLSLKKIYENRKCFQSPITGATAKEMYTHCLNVQDYQDILSFEKIYYVQKTNNYKLVHTENDFQYFNFQANSHINYRYEQLEFLGRGSFGTVVKCFDHKTQKFVAIKAIFDQEEDRKQIDLEVDYLKKLAEQDNGALNHHVLSLIETFTFRGFFCIVTELNEIDLYTYLKNRNFNGLELSEIKQIGRQLADALAFIHSARIAHSDIKPENIMFTDASKANISVIDFGCACMDREPLYSLVQSLYYRSPEVIFNFKYGCEIDTWSYACVLFELATGTPLFHVRDEDALIEKMAEIVGAPPLEMIVRSKKMKSYFEQVPANRAKYEKQKKAIITKKLKNIDSELADLICSCLEWLPAKRPSMKSILDHKFFKSE